MYYVAIEDTDTYDVTEFEKVTEETVLYLMDGYKVDKHDVTGFSITENMDGKKIVYDGVIYRGGFGYNLWVASKYVKL